MLGIRQHLGVPEPANRRRGSTRSRTVLFYTPERCLPAFNAEQTSLVAAESVAMCTWVGPRACPSAGGGTHGCGPADGREFAHSASAAPPGMTTRRRTGASGSSWFWCCVASLRGARRKRNGQQGPGCILHRRSRPRPDPSSRQRNARSADLFPDVLSANENSPANGGCVSKSPEPT
jgi:hypothetical protein